MWQTLILKQQNPVFEFLPIEKLIKERQSDYYHVLSKSDKSGKSTPFIEFMLEVINDSLEDLLNIQNLNLTGEDRMNHFKDFIKADCFTRKDYLKFHKNISPATASRDLKKAIEKNLLKKERQPANNKI